MQVYLYITPTIIYGDQDSCVMTLKVESSVFKLDVFLTKFGHKLLLSLSAQSNYV